MTAKPRCLKVGCDNPAGGHDHPNGGGCPMCERCCLGEEAMLKGTPLERRLNALLDAGEPVTPDQVRSHLEGFARPDAPDERIRATCKALARRVNALLDGSYQPEPARPFPGQHLGDTFESEPFTPCEVCGGLFVWWVNRPRVCNRMPCRPELHRQEEAAAQEQQRQRREEEEAEPEIIVQPALWSGE